MNIKCSNDHYMDSMVNDNEKIIYWLHNDSCYVDMYRLYQ